MSRAGFRGLVRGNVASVDARHLRAGSGVSDGRPRVLLLGDSVLFGPGLPGADTPGPLLEHLLDGRVQVLNASTVGWATEHELVFLEQAGEEMDPSLLVLGYCLNDPLGRETVILENAAEKAASGWAGALVDVNLWLRKHSLFFVWLKGSLGADLKEHGSRPTWHRS